jgi:hypothetical protein
LVLIKIERRIKMLKMNMILAIVLLLFSTLDYGAIAANKDKDKDNNKPLQLAGTTWTIVNKTIDPIYAGFTGQVTFSQNSLTVDSGRFAAAGLVSPAEGNICNIPITPISYEMLGNSDMYVSWNTNPGPPGPSILTNWDATIHIVVLDKLTLVFIGDSSSCGTYSPNGPRISILTRVP